MLTLNAWTNSSYFCAPLRPPSPLGPVDNSTGTYCPVPAGPFAFSASVPWGNNRALTTLNTRLRAVDPLSNELLCMDVSTTPVSPGRLSSPYGNAAIIFWVTVVLAIAYWLVVGIARIISAWDRGVRPRAGVWTRVESAGLILVSAISGERMATSPALMRFSALSICVPWRILGHRLLCNRHSIDARYRLSHPVVCCVGYGCCSVANIYL